MLVSLGFWLELAVVLLVWLVSCSLAAEDDDFIMHGLPMSGDERKSQDQPSDAWCQVWSGGGAVLVDEGGGA